MDEYRLLSPQHKGRDCKLSMDLPVWRYMNFAKFAHLFETRNLFFCRADNFEDKLEGHYPTHWMDRFNNSFKENEISSTADDFLKYQRSRSFINSWFDASDGYEDIGMWQRYGMRQDGVAVISTTGKLSSHLAQWAEKKSQYTVLVGKVKYGTDILAHRWDINPYEKIYLAKDGIYTSEKEIRCVIGALRHPETVESPVEENGIDVLIDTLAELITEVVVSPYAPAWLHELVRIIACRANIHARESDKTGTV
ncbi:MAG: hypothetical protein ACI9CO_000116 [Candidatus Azotimanducaceae bacterium]|jgi:hypothetical protein